MRRPHSWPHGLGEGAGNSESSAQRTKGAANGRQIPPRSAGEASRELLSAQATKFSVVCEFDMTFVRFSLQRSLAALACVLVRVVSQDRTGFADTRPHSGGGR